MTVSIAICTHNGEKFLKEQIHSCLNQSVPPDEIVVCDDMSTDETLNIAKDLALQNSGIAWQILRNEKRLGAKRNFERAIALCTKEVILLCDQDDVWIQNKIEKITHYFSQHPDCGGLFSNALLIDDLNKDLEGTLLDNSFFKEAIRKNYTKEDLLYWSILLGNIMTGATMAVRRSMLPLILPFHLDLGRLLWHDGWIGYCLMGTGKMELLDESLIKYRVHANQQIGLVSRTDSFVNSVLYGTKFTGKNKDYFQRYLMAYTFLQRLKSITSLNFEIVRRIEIEFLNEKRKYFKSQSVAERKLRLLKWYLTNKNHISLKDLVEL